MATFYFGVFIIGFALCALSFVFGAAGHWFGDGFLGHGGAGHGHAHAADGDGLPLLNFGTVTAFMTWFGGVGFLLSAYSSVVAALTAGIAMLAGVGGAGAVVLFMKEVLLRDQIPMESADYHMPGMLARVTVTIPRGGSGEIVYTQGGSRKTAAARGADGEEIGKGTEVVVLRYERGTAHVRPWHQMAEAEHSQ
jgi:membrane protein implicated in regulation of membrane protease activity